MHWHHILHLDKTHAAWETCFEGEWRAASLLDEQELSDSPPLSSPSSTRFASFEADFMWWGLLIPCICREGEKKWTIPKNLSCHSFEKICFRMSCLLYHTIFPLLPEYRNFSNRQVHRFIINKIRFNDSCPGFVPCTPRERERETQYCIQIHKHVPREYEQRDTNTERKWKKTHTRETHTHNVNVYTTYISLTWWVTRPKTRTREEISTMGRGIKTSYNESDMCQEDFCPILSVSGNSV
jgi:hypothetical protein